MRITDGQRAAMRLGGTLMIVLGVLALVFSVWFPGAESDSSPLPVSAGEAVALPAPGLFGGRPTLYGAVADATDPPGLAELGCRGQTSSGGAVPVFDMAWVDHEPQEVDGRSLTPLLTVGPFGEGATITCSGPAASTAAPLYLLRGGVDAGLARVALIAFGVVSLAIGAAAVIVLRRRPR